MSTITYKGIEISIADDAMWLSKVREGLCLTAVPFQSFEMCQAAIAENPFRLEDVNPSHLRFRGEEHRYLELCKQAITEVSATITQVKAHCLTAEQYNEMWLLAIGKSGQIIRLQDQPTPEMCRLAVSTDGMAMKFIPEQTFELCKTAVLQNYGAIQFVKPCDEYEELCAYAVSQESFALKYIPNPSPAIERLARHVANQEARTGEKKAAKAAQYPLGLNLSKYAL